ncbi:MAG: phosphoribosyltransferase family protein [Luminiphilus sp.]|nr:phosphoribosyltransferase family protein [Luminiphilus sp.]MDG2037968.1 phosphoribosyltransferase family protein [Luminiphilus sp.]
MKKQFIEEEQLLEEAFKLAITIFDSGFRPDFIVGIWRGGSTVGIYVQECLQYLGIKTDHISIRTSYRGQPSYGELVDNPDSIRVHGLQYLFENLNRDDKLLIVDDVFSSGYNVEGVIQRLQKKCRRNMPEEVRVAVPYYKPGQNLSGRKPDYFLHTTEDWLVLPYELQGLSIEDIIEHKPSVAHILGSVMKQP